MKNKVSKKLILLAVSGMSLGVISFASPLTVSASHYTTPKALRGTWYQYHHSDNNYTVVSISAHQFSFVGPYGHSLYTPDRSGIHKLWVTKDNEFKGGSVYTFNRIHYHYQSLGMFWVGKRKINGHYRKVLKSYYDMGGFAVYLKQPVKHDYSYTVKGSWNNVSKHVGR
ncbi:hypothetical protein OF387_01875 [Lentilactobacillus hilgardii]|nr:hypothetical protein [Lentilactobacillus hilgardii]MCV3739965.1 hypothetical protein [Lentilactobacillus hilgardii]